MDPLDDEPADRRLLSHLEQIVEARAAHEGRRCRNQAIGGPEEGGMDDRPGEAE